MARKIFISYRRQDSGSIAIAIAEYLGSRFGLPNVFFDLDQRAGARFPVELDRALDQSKVLLVLIGSRWFDASDQEGRQRLQNPDDWVRMEIAHALRRNITIIPVLIDGAALPQGEQLPPDIRALVEHQAARLRSAEGFRSDMRQIADDIRAVPDPWPLRNIAIGLAGTLVLLVGSALGYQAFFSSAPVPDPTPAPPLVEPPSPTLLKGAVTFKSTAGDYIGDGQNWTFTDIDGHITAKVDKNTLSISLDGDDDWSIDFAAPAGKRLEAGAYNGATRAPFNSPTKPGLSVSGAGRGCNELKGSFNIRELVYSRSGEGIEKLKADFKQHCEGTGPALDGAIDLSAPTG